MRKLILLSACAVAALSSCARTEVPSVQKEISFRTVNRVQTKAAGVEYTGGDFGTYAWFNGTDEFMLNETIGLSAGEWKAIVNSFYWPKTGSIDFISYSPFSGSNGAADSTPAVTQTAITYTDVTVDGNTDLLYADKVTCSANVDDITDDASPESGFEGVPTFFRHALAKISFCVQATFLEYGTAPDKTTWEVTLKKAVLKGVYNQGSCALTLNGADWDKPAGEIWTPSASATTLAAQDLAPSAGLVLTTSAQPLEALAQSYIMPQTFETGQQQLELSFDIKTTLANGNIINETYATTLDLKSAIASLKINQNLVYTIRFKPVKYVSTYDDPTDVVITFDPAVADWETVSASAIVSI